MELSLWHTVITALTATLLSLGIGGGLAWYDYQHSTSAPRWFRSWWLTILFLPQLYVAIGLVKVLASVHLLYTPWAIIIGYCYYNIPLAYLGIQTKLTNQLNHYEQTAAVLGARRWTIFWSITWPRLQRSVLGIGCVIFLYCFTSFLLPSTLGGIRWQTSEVHLYQLIELYHNFPAAIWLAGVQSLILIGLVIIVQRSHRRLPEQIRPRPLPSKTRAWQIVASICWLIPSYIMLRQSDWAGLWQLQIWPALGRGLGLCLAVLVVVYAVLYIAKIGRLTILLLTISPVTLSLLWLLWFGQGYISVILALSCAALPLSGYIYDQIWSARPDHLLPTATVLGASQWQLRRLQFNWLKPAWIQIAAVTVALVLGDATITRLLLTPAHYPIMAQSFSLLSSYHFKAAAAEMTIVVGIIAVGVFFTQFIYDRQR